MKKNLPISLLILFTVFTVLSGNSTYHHLSLQYRSYSNYETENNNLSFLKIDFTNYPELVPHANETIFGLSHPEHKDKLYSIVSDEIGTKEIYTGGWISGCCAHNFFEDPVSGDTKKGDDRITNQVGGAGVVLVSLYFEFTKFFRQKIGKISYYFCFTKNGQVKIFF